MSFVKKAVKKVFKGVKKVVKKTVSFAKRVVKSDWFKIAAVVGLSLFTAGVASGGFVASTGGIGGFFSSVGATMSNGWTAITSTVTGMFGPGAASGTVAGGTQPLMTASIHGTGGLLGTGASTAAGAAASSAGTFLSPLASNIAAGAATSGGLVAGAKGILGKFGNLLMDPGLGGTMMRQGIMSGMQSMAQQKQLDKQEDYFRSRTVWGGPAFGGDAEPMQFLQPNASVAQQQAASPAPETPIEMQQAQQRQGPPKGMSNVGAPVESGQAFAQAPIPNQAPPAQQPVQGRSSNPGLLDLETMGAYNA